MLSALTLFATGSAICGAASSMNMLIIGRGLSCASPTVLCLLKQQSNRRSGVGSGGDHFVGANYAV